MIVALGALLIVVAVGSGGYEPWATFVLEVGAVALLTATCVRTLWRSSSESTSLALRRGAWKKLPFRVRHPWIGRLAGRPSSPDVEIILPGQRDEDEIDLDVGRYSYVLGVPIKRTGMVVPALLITLWIVLGALPIDTRWLALVSPEAHRWWTDALGLLGGDSPAAAPWSLAPFLTLRSLWLWLAVLGIFFVTLGAARRAEGAVRLSLLLLLAGALSGALGVFDWLSEFQALLGKEPGSLRATGSFGNANHYAAFQGMLLLVSLGWLSYYREAKDRRRGREPWDRHALALIAGLGILLSGLGLVLSLSRSGLACALAGCAVWAMMTSGRNRGAFVTLGLAIAGFTAWISVGPLLDRFENLEEEWLREEGRTAVWRDSVPAVSDYWLTGSGLSSFRYVGTAYRSFGGRIFYSWAHNDYLQLGIELGLPGLLLLVWFMVAAIAAARRARNELTSEPALLHLHAGFVAAVVAIALHSLTDFSLHLPANLALLAILLAVVVGISHEDPRGVPERSDRVDLAY